MECRRCRAPFSSVSQKQGACALCGEPVTAASSSPNVDTVQAVARNKSAAPKTLGLAVAIGAAGVLSFYLQVPRSTGAARGASSAKAAASASSRSRPSASSAVAAEAKPLRAGRGFTGPPVAHGAGPQRGNWRGSLTLGKPSVSGELPPEVIRRIVRQVGPPLRTCYEKGLRKMPGLQGRITVRFVIGRDGRLSNVSGGGDMPDGGVVSCVTRMFYGLSFPKPRSGVVTVSQPLVFSPVKKTSKPSQVLKARVRIHGVGVAGGAVKNAQSVVTRMQGRFRACYETALRKDPNVAGSVTLVARIGSKGEVLGVSGGGGGNVRTIVGCLKAVVQSGGFEPPKRVPSVLSIPLTFHSS